MNIKELRLGNILKSQNGEIFVLNESVFCYLLDTGGNSIKEISPVILTEEWLLRAGFERDNDGILCIDYQGTECKFYWVIADGCEPFLQVAAGYMPISNYKHIKHIHQLQNLYFALTEKELEFK